MAREPGESRHHPEHYPSSRYRQELAQWLTVASSQPNSREAVWTRQVLQKLCAEFVGQNQIQRHLDNRSFEQYAQQLSRLKPNTAEWFQTQQVVRWLNMCRTAARQTDFDAAQLSAEYYPIFLQGIQQLGQGSTATLSSTAIRKERRPLPLKPIAGVAAAAIAAGAVAYSVEHWPTTPEVHSPYEQIPPEWEAHMIGANHVAEPQPLPAWLNVRETKPGVYAWGDRTVLQQPNGSALYLPQEYQNNKAFMLPPDANGHMDWLDVRFPTELIHELQLTLQADGLWADPQGQRFAVLDAGHLLLLDVDGKPTQIIRFNQHQAEPLPALTELYPQPIDPQSIDTTIPSGYIDVSSYPGLEAVQCHLSYASYNNSAFGVPVYPKEYKCQIESSAASDLVAAVAELNAQGLNLGIGDAKRPYAIQKLLFDTLPRGWVANPDKNPPHVAGIAMDITLLDQTYIPVLHGGYKPLPEYKKGKALHSPTSLEDARQQGWDDTEYHHWKTASDIFAAHHFHFIKSERWHLEHDK